MAWGDKAAVGDIVNLYNAKYRVTEVLGRKGWYVQCLKTGNIYRMRVKDMLYGTVIKTTEAQCKN